MKRVLTVVVSLFCFSALSNESITTMTDYSRNTMEELAATPPLVLLKNNKGESRHELIAGIYKGKVDDPATVSWINNQDITSQERGDANGFGLGYGYSKSWKDRWAWYFLFQWAKYDGSHKQTINGVTTISVDDIEGQTMVLGAGISYEFLRDIPKHTLNFFGGPAILSLDVTGQIKTYDSTNGSLSSKYQGHYDGLLPSAIIGLMYDYDFSKKYQIMPYAMLVYSFADECQTYVVDHVEKADEFVTSNSPLCGEVENTSGEDGQTDISPSFYSIGIKFTYIPWGLSVNASGMIRNLITRNDEERRAPVKGTLFSLSKSW